MCPQSYTQEAEGRGLQVQGHPGLKCKTLAQNHCCCFVVNYLQVERSSETLNELPKTHCKGAELPGTHVVRLAFVEKGPITIAGFCSRVSLPEEPPTAPPQNVIASGRTNQSIMIQWQPPPESHQNGILKGYIIRYGAILGPGGFRTLAGWARGVD